MTTETAKAAQTVLFTLDDEGGELPIDEYLKLLQYLQQNIQQRIKYTTPEVEKKMNDIKK